MLHIELYNKVGIPGLPGEDEDQAKKGPGQRLAKGNSLISEISRDIIGDVQKITSDPGLNRTGKQARLREIPRTRNVLEKFSKTFFDFIWNPLFSSDWPRAENEFKLFVRGDLSNPVTYMVRMDLRAGIRALESKEREEVLQRAVEEADLDVIRAFADRAEIHRLISPERAIQAAENVYRKLHPESAAELALMRTGIPRLSNATINLLQNLINFGYPEKQILELTSKIPAMKHEPTRGEISFLRQESKLPDEVQKFLNTNKGNLISLIDKIRLSRQ